MSGSRVAGRPGIRLAYLAALALFLWGVARFYDRGTGFSSLIDIGDEANPPVTALARVPHYVYEDSAGYDGVYYVQLALNPTLANPELKDTAARQGAIDNPGYRARRILFCWLAWLLGLGQPAAIVQVYALINVAAWLALGWVLLRWFPPTDGENCFRWCGVMFSHGVCMSVRDSLVDAPTLLLVALALAALEAGRRGRARLIFGLVGLGKETDLLGVGALAELDSRGAWREIRTWRRWAGTVALVVAPLLVWMAYVRWRFGPADDTGLGNFTWPFAGLAEKCATVVADLCEHPFSSLYRAAAGAVLAIIVQFFFLALRPRLQSAWWRLGAALALLMVFLSTPVWEGYPGAFTRVLLPMTLAFNVLVPRGRRWYAILIAGNLSMLAGFHEAVPPLHEFAAIVGTRPSAESFSLQRGGGWYPVENFSATHWRWSSGNAELRIHNAEAVPATVHLRGEAESASDQRELRITLGSAVRWSGTLAEAPVKFEFDGTLVPGENVLGFETNRPAHPVGADVRKLAFRISNLEIVVPPPR